MGILIRLNALPLRLLFVNANKKKMVYCVAFHAQKLHICKQRETKTVQTTGQQKRQRRRMMRTFQHIQWKLSSGSFVLNVHSCHFSSYRHKLAVRCVSGCVCTLCCSCVFALIAKIQVDHRVIASMRTRVAISNGVHCNTPANSQRTVNTHTKKRNESSTHIWSCLWNGVRVFSSVAAEARLIRAWARMLLANYAWLVKYLRVLWS